MESVKLLCVIMVLFGAVDANSKGRNCYEAWLSGETPNGGTTVRANGYYDIDPDGGGPITEFKVWCDMDNGGVTHVRHDEMTLTPVTNAAQGTDVTLTYDNGVTVEQMVGLIESSRSCRQWLRLDCQNVFLYNGDIASTYWKDRDGVTRGNWGTETNVAGCQCRVDGDCDNGESRCNCDAETGSVQSDSGYITDPDHLPITALFIDEVDAVGENAWYLVSSLQCSESSRDFYPSCDALKEAGLLSVDGEYLIDPDGLDTGEAPFIVRCDASTGNTVVVHSKPGEIAVPEGPGTPGYYVIDPTYANSVTNDELALLVASSEECWQWLSLSCRSARIFDEATDTPISWWIANDGDAQLNWGGAPEGVAGCACSQQFNIDLSDLTPEQSSTDGANTADLATDGDSATCQETLNDGTRSWWAIDLGQEFCINGVHITNTATLNQRLTGAYVTVGNSQLYSSNTHCSDPLASTEVNAPGGEVNVYCEQTMCGRYVAVILPDDVLSMCEVEIIGFKDFPHQAIELEDLDAEQSSVKFDGTADLAIDGNDNPDFGDGESCIVTDAETGVAQWWAVHFDEYQCVSRVVIKNRLDCCSNHLQGAVVRVGSDDTYGDNDICGTVVDETQAGAEVVILCAQPVCGLYLSIHQAPGGYLTFCEVHAYEPIPHDEPCPLAGLSVDQSTAYEGGDENTWALRAIDGDDNPDWSGETCTATEEDQNSEQWWAVDLGENTNKCITRVVIRNRADCCYDRISEAVVRIGNSDDYDNNPKCGEVEEAQARAGALITVWCTSPRCGRYISIHQNDGERIVSLCEVWAYQTLPPLPNPGSCEIGDQCSCDANDAELRQDAGFVRDQGALPIQQVRIGDIVDDAVDTANVEIGPLVCEGANVPVLRSCQELFAAGFEYSGHYEIDPDGPEGFDPIFVYCNMTDTGGVTCIGHDEEEPRWVPENSDLAGEYTRNVDYTPQLDQIYALINSSVYCQQYLRLDCWNYEIWSGSSSYTWWMDRNLVRQENWGSPTGTLGCDCGATGGSGCTNGQSRCNCDNNAAAWNWDDGYITDKSLLPIRRVRSGGIAGSNEKARVTVGQLKCWGLNECQLDLDRCHILAECTDTDEGYECECRDGYEGDGYECQDIDECERDTDNCAEGRSECTNTEGSFECECKDGYQGDGVNCNDIHECDAGDGQCHENALCQNGDGNYICVCKDGYVGDGVNTCEDINECSDDTDVCDRTAVCDNTLGGYNCLCPSGYDGSGTTDNPCNDIDECALNTDDCGVHGYCVNIQGTFSCQCNPGYEGNGKTCVDVNECALNTDNCDEYASCLNTDGDFICECLDNFRGDGRQCVDINECAESRDDCSDYADCINTNGGYGCQCWEDYHGDGRVCSPPPTQEPPLLNTEAIIGIAVAGAGLLLLLLIICCCCFMFTQAPAAPVPAPQPYLEQPPPPQQQQPIYLEEKRPEQPQVVYLQEPDRLPPQRSFIDRAPLIPPGSYAPNPYAYGRGNFNSNNSTDRPTTTKQVFYNPSFSGRQQPQDK